MTSLVAPRFELPLVDNKGRVSREWYKFLVNLAKSVDSSPSSLDDQMISLETEVDPPTLEFQNGGTGVGGIVRTVNFTTAADGLGATLSGSTLTVTALTTHTNDVWNWMNM